MLRHELPFRGPEALKLVAARRVHILGAGAIGSNLAVTLARQGFENMTVYDFDRVESHNIGNQAYGLDDVGSIKTAALNTIIFASCGLEITQIPIKVTDKILRKHVSKTDLIVDCFDNSASRKLVFDLAGELSLDCVHAGFNGPYAEIRWNEKYIVPSDAGEDVCEYPLARNLVTLLVSVLAEVIVRYVTRTEKINESITFNDLKLHRD